MKNWRTTAGGLSAGLSAIAGGIKLIAAGDYINGALALSAGASVIYALFHAQDKGAQ